VDLIGYHSVPFLGSIVLNLHTMKGKIYKITCLITNKVYIGQTTQVLDKRWECHLRDAFKYNRQTKLARALRKYGKENFRVEIISEDLDLEVLNKVEEDFISEFDSAECGYNIKPGGRNTPHSKETRDKIAQANSKRKWTPEMRHRMAESIRKSPKCKIVLTPEIIQKRKIANTGSKRETHSRLKMSKVQRELNGIRVKCNEDGKEFSSIAEASEYYKMPKIAISAVANGRQKRTAAGLTFSKI
jgi:group I intron endonuclease